MTWRRYHRDLRMMTVLALAVCTLIAASPTKTEAEAEAGRLGDQAAAAFEGGAFREAAELYRRAESLLSGVLDRHADRALVVYFGACALEAAGELVAAMNELRRSLELPLESPHREDARRRLTNLEAKTKAIVSVECEWPYARLTLDDEPESRPCGDPLAMAPGQHRIRASQPVGTETFHSLETIAGGRYELRIPRTVAVVADTTTIAPERSVLAPALITTLSATLLVGSFIALGVSNSEAGRADDAFAIAADPMASLVSRRAGLDETQRLDARADRDQVIGWSLLGTAILTGLWAAWWWLAD